MSLSPRLRAIADNILEDLPLADIGTDHGYIPIELVQDNRIPKVIATDIRNGPLSRAREAVDQKNLQERIDLRLGSGLQTLRRGEVDQVVIAGMGGKMISDILKDDLDKAHQFTRLILQPMKNIPYLRSFLFENGFQIIKDFIVKEGKFFYSVLVVEPGQVSDFTAYDLEYGYTPARVLNSDYAMYLKRQIEILKNRIEQMQDSNNIKTIRRRYDFERRLVYVKKLYESITNSQSY